MWSYISLGNTSLCEMMGTIAGLDLSYNCSYRTFKEAKAKAEELKERFPNAKAIKGHCPKNHLLNL